MAMTPEKTAVRKSYDLTEDSDSRRQLSLCELTTTDMSHLQLTPTMLKDGQILEKRHIWENRHMLRSDGGLVETQLGCQHHELGSNPTTT